MLAGPVDNAWRSLVLIWLAFDDRGEKCGLRRSSGGEVSKLIETRTCHDNLK